MTDTPKPLTADEIAEFTRLGPQFVARLKATIEQQAGQIEKLREVAEAVADDMRYLANMIDGALTATEPIHDK